MAADQWGRFLRVAGRNRDHLYYSGLSPHQRSSPVLHEPRLCVHAVSGEYPSLVRPGLGRVGPGLRDHSGEARPRALRAPGAHCAWGGVREVVPPEEERAKRPGACAKEAGHARLDRATSRTLLGEYGYDLVERFGHIHATRGAHTACRAEHRALPFTYEEGANMRRGGLEPSRKKGRR